MPSIDEIITMLFSELDIKTKKIEISRLDPDTIQQLIQKVETYDGKQKPMLFHLYHTIGDDIPEIVIDNITKEVLINCIKDDKSGEDLKGIISNLPATYQVLILKLLFKFSCSEYLSEIGINFIELKLEHEIVLECLAYCIRNHDVVFSFVCLSLLTRKQMYISWSSDIIIGDKKYKLFDMFYNSFAVDSESDYKKDYFIYAKKLLRVINFKSLSSEMYYKSEILCNIMNFKNSYTPPSIVKAMTLIKNPSPLDMEKLFSYLNDNSSYLSSDLHLANVVLKFFYRHYEISCKRHDTGGKIAFLLSKMCHKEHDQLRVGLIAHGQNAMANLLEAQFRDFSCDQSVDDLFNEIQLIVESYPEQALGVLEIFLQSNAIKDIQYRYFAIKLCLPTISLDERIRTLHDIVNKGLLNNVLSFKFLESKETVLFKLFSLHYNEEEMDHWSNCLSDKLENASPKCIKISIESDPKLFKTLFIRRNIKLLEVILSKMEDHSIPIFLIKNNCQFTVQSVEWALSGSDEVLTLMASRFHKTKVTEWFTTLLIQNFSRLYALLLNQKESPDILDFLDISIDPLIHLPKQVNIQPIIKLLMENYRGMMKYEKFSRKFLLRCLSVSTKMFYQEHARIRDELIAHGQDAMVNLLEAQFRDFSSGQSVDDLFKEIQIIVETYPEQTLDALERVSQGNDIKDIQYRYFAIKLCLPTISLDERIRILHDIVSKGLLNNVLSFKFLNSKETVLFKLFSLHCEKEEKEKMDHWSNCLSEILGIASSEHINSFINDHPELFKILFIRRHIRLLNVILSKMNTPSAEIFFVNNMHQFTVQSVEWELRGNDSVLTKMADKFTNTKITEWFTTLLIQNFSTLYRLLLNHDQSTVILGFLDISINPLEHLPEKVEIKPIIELLMENYRGIIKYEMFSRSFLSLLHRHHNNLFNITPKQYCQAAFQLLRLGRANDINFLTKIMKENNPQNHKNCSYNIYDTLDVILNNDHDGILSRFITSDIPSAADQMNFIFCFMARFIWTDVEVTDFQYNRFNEFLFDHDFYAKDTPLFYIFINEFLEFCNDRFEQKNREFIEQLNPEPYYKHDLLFFMVAKAAVKLKKNSKLIDRAQEFLDIAINRILCNLKFVFEYNDHEWAKYLLSKIYEYKDDFEDAFTEYHIENGSACMHSNFDHQFLYDLVSTDVKTGMAEQLIDWILLLKSVDAKAIYRMNKIHQYEKVKQHLYLRCFSLMRFRIGLPELATISDPDFKAWVVDFNEGIKLRVGKSDEDCSGVLIQGKAFRKKQSIENAEKILTAAFLKPKFIKYYFCNYFYTKNAKVRYLFEGLISAFNKYGLKLFDKIQEIDDNSIIQVLSYLYLFAVREEGVNLSVNLTGASTSDRKLFELFNGWETSLTWIIEEPDDPSCVFDGDMLGIINDFITSLFQSQNTESSSYVSIRNAVGSAPLYPNSVIEHDGQLYQASAPPLEDDVDNSLARDIAIKIVLIKSEIQKDRHKDQRNTVNSQLIAIRDELDGIINALDIKVDDSETTTSHNHLN